MYAVGETIQTFKSVNPSPEEVCLCGSLASYYFSLLFPFNFVSSQFFSSLFIFLFIFYLFLFFLIVIFTYTFTFINHYHYHLCLWFILIFIFYPYFFFLFSLLFSHFFCFIIFYFFFLRLISFITYSVKRWQLYLTLKNTVMDGEGNHWKSFEKDFHIRYYFYFIFFLFINHLIVSEIIEKYRLINQN